MAAEKDTLDQRSGAPEGGTVASPATSLPAGDGGGTTGRGGPLAISYERALAAWLDSHKYYPLSLRRRGIEGEGKLRIRITRSGHVLAVDIASAFPHPSLEAISQDWVKRAEPFPPVPDAIPGDTYVFVVPVGFRLQ
jgi:protein TonB